MKKSKKAESWRELVTSKAFDLIIVIAGITIAYQLNSLKESRDDRALEQFYLESLITDLDMDIKEYEDNMNEFNHDRQFAYNTLKRMEKGVDVGDSIGFAVLNITSTKTFEGHNNTFSTLMSANGMSVVEDQGVRETILEHYRLYASIERFERENAELIGRFHSHFTSLIDYSQVGLVIDQAGATNSESKNLLTLAVVQLQSGIWRYQESLTKAKELRALIVASWKNS